MHNEQKAWRVIEFLKRNKCNVSFLQETHFDNKLQNKLNQNSNFEVFTSNGTTSSKGVAILIDKYKTNYEILSKFSDQDGRLLLLNVKIEESIFSLLCVYAPNSRTLRNSFFKRVHDFLREKGIGIPIIGGDFNESFKKIDRKSLRAVKIEEPVSSLKSLIKANKLIDIWRVFNPNVQQFTWRRKDKSQASRIDFILIGENFQSFIHECKIKPVIIQSTDHQGVFLTFQPGTAQRGRGFWKLNNSVLQDKNYREIIDNLLDKYLKLKRENKQNFDIRLMWDVLKIEIKDATIQYCKKLARDRGGIKRELEKELEDREKLKDELGVEIGLLTNEITKIEKELAKIYEQEAKGAQVRSMEKWVECGEKNNSYFLGLEKQRQVKKIN